MTRSPTRWARGSRSQVLSRMVHYKSITPAQAAAANETPLPTVVHDAPGIVTPLRLLRRPGGEPAAPLRHPLGATRDERAQRPVHRRPEDLHQRGAVVAGHAQKVAVADIPSSLPHVVAAFAVIDPADRQRGSPCGRCELRHRPVRRGHPGRRQPGSGFKLFTLIGALERTTTSMTRSWLLHLAPSCSRGCLRRRL